MATVDTAPVIGKHDDLLIMSSTLNLDEVAGTAQNETDPNGSDVEDVADDDSFVQDYEDENGEPWIPVPSKYKGPYVQVEVGVETFKISKVLLCESSSYFHAALNGGFMEAKTNRILLDERLELFEIFHTWLYKNDLDFLELEAELKEPMEVQTAYVELYCFADRRGVMALGDQILKKFDQFVRPEGMPVRLDTGIISLVWSNLPENSGLCRYLVAIERDATRCHLPSREEIDYDWLPGYFISALLKLTDDETDWFHKASVQKQPIDVAELHRVVKQSGGSTAVDAQRNWGKVCKTMDVKAPQYCNEGKLQGHMRALYRKWLCPWDTKLTSSERLAAEEECPRPLVKEFLHGAVPTKKTGIKVITVSNNDYQNWILSKKDG
ncbi:hypothetical protein D6D20_09330 [Aureobasidium pullulans]|uniref:BTB domain-containing protein n=1 Tax=Aureobasidium pullulans TaxID=5580 RepID=A0A4S8YSK0_AURPU|nr:hypothetical protein D6D20_09330 [Aureobasidium pullulans]